MPRWVVPKRYYVEEAAANSGLSTSQFESEAEKLPQPENYADKLVKYVPAEVLAFTLPAAALNSTNRNWLFGILALGALATPLYHLASSRSAAAKRPKRYFYLLSFIAFFPWAVGASPAIAGLTAWSSAQTTTVLMIATLVVPVIDTLMDSVTDSPLQVRELVRVFGSGLTRLGRRMRHPLRG